MPAQPGRFSDAQTYLDQFRDEVWVRCPQCSTTGVIESTTSDRYSPRFTCGGCAMRIERRPSQPIGNSSGRVRESAFGLELVLQAPCKGETLWAYNPRHLRFIADFVSGTLRERTPNYNQTLASRLPRWIKSSNNRAAVLKAVRQIEASVLS